MIDYHRFCQIQHLHAHQGLTASQIAKELALDPRTVVYWLGQEHFRPRQATPRSSKLDPFKPERLLLDSRVVDLPMAYNPILVLLSSLKPLFFNSLKNELRFSDNAGA